MTRNRTAARPNTPAPAETPAPAPAETPAPEAAATTPAGWPADLGDPTPGKPNHTPAKEKPAPSPIAGCSGSQIRAIARLARTEAGGMTRAELHADPMVVVALCKRGLATQNRDGDDRSIDWIELTPAGKTAAQAI